MYIYMHVVPLGYRHNSSRCDLVVDIYYASVLVSLIDDDDG